MSIEIYAGHFGSGKTELVLNRAVELAAAGEEVHVIDLDIVKPYFRSREAHRLLQDTGVKLVTPGGALDNADLPVISAQVLGTLASAQGHILLDVGGDAMGATVLGSIATHLVRQPQAYIMYLVVNPYRPFTKDVQGITKIAHEIEMAARLKFSGIISNPNLGWDTKIADLQKGYEQVREYARILQLPIMVTAVTDQYFSLVAPKISGPCRRVRNFLVPPWELEEGQVFDIDPNLRLPRERRNPDVES